MSQNTGAPPPGSDGDANETWDPNVSRPFDAPAPAGVKVIGWPQPPASAAPSWGEQPLSVSAAKAIPAPESAPVRRSQVFSIMDRQVQVQDADNPAPLYVMCRKWVQNDPDNEVETIPSQPNLLQLPPVKPKEDAVDQEPPNYEDDFDDYDPEEALRTLKEHWVAVRQWHVRQQRQQCHRFTDRMKTMMPGAMLQVGQQGPQGAQGPHASATVMQ